MIFMDLIGKTSFKLIASGVTIAALVGMCSLRDQRIEQRGAVKVTTAIAKQTSKINAKASQARAAVRADDDPIKRLRERACRDCAN